MHVLTALTRRRGRSSRRSRTGRGIAAVVAVGAAVAATGALSVGTAAPASAERAGTVHRGAGRVIVHGTDWVGQYRVSDGRRSVIVYCIDPDKRQPSHLRLATVARVPRLSTTVTRELAEVLAAHGQTADRGRAEATSQALNYLAGNRAAVARRARYLARSTQALAMRYVAEARRLRGGYTVRLHLSGAPMPGQTGHGPVTVTGAAGGVPATLTLTHSGNVTTPRTVRTSRAGSAGFTFRTTGTGQVHVTAGATRLPPVTVRVSTPARGYQRMVSVSAPTRAHAAAAYQGRVSGFGNHYSCTSQCDGHPTVTLRACAPGGAWPSRLTYGWSGPAGHGTRSVDFAAGRARSCRSTAVTLPDGVRVTARWQYRTPHGWTGAVPAAGTFTVDCPPAPTVAVAVSYDCATASVTAVLGRTSGATLVPVRNTTGHPMTLTLSGAVAARLTLPAGGTATPHSWPLACGQHARVTVTGSVQRHGGGVNTGRPVTVSVP